jgi:flagellar biosynthetic protein FliP
MLQPMDGLFSITARAHPAMPLDTLLALTALSLAPFALVMTTSFVRIVVVLSLVRSAIGAAALPPNTVLTGLALTLTCVIMAPTFTRISAQAIVPYSHGAIAQSQFVERALEPLRDFMVRQSRAQDVALFERLGHTGDRAPAGVPFPVLTAAFVVGELRAGFAIGLALYLPFVAIDLAVASILMGLGMFMLSPPVISLPAKLLLFVMVNGWALVCGGVVASFR